MSTLAQLFWSRVILRRPHRNLMSTSTQFGADLDVILCQPRFYINSVFLCLPRRDIMPTSAYLYVDLGVISYQLRRTLLLTS